MKKLRIGILTFHFSDNFGALLQAYGLRQWLTELGHSVEFINYHPSHVESGGNFKGLWDPRAFKANAKIAYLKASTLRQRLFGDKRQERAFQLFRTNELHLSGRVLPTREAVEAHLASMEHPYDLIIVGSDQIWSASAQHGLDRVYFADFAVPTETRRISYAPSFGRATIELDNPNELKRMLSALDGISCRERSGATIVQGLLGRDVSCVPDPTLLLGNFDPLVSSANGLGGHVFCYALRSGKGIRDVANWIGAQLEREIISPFNVHRRWPEIGKTVHPSPSEWVGMVANAGFVVTNSFHGTVFSILLQRPFLVVGLPGARASLNERALNLLGELGLSDRFVENGDLTAAKQKFVEPIDWTKAVANLQKLQSIGRNYLTLELSKLDHLSPGANI